MKLLQGLSAPGMRRYSVSVHSIGTKNAKKRRLGGSTTGGGRWEGRNRDFMSVPKTDRCTVQGKISSVAGILFVTIACFQTVKD